MCDDCVLLFTRILVVLQREMIWLISISGPDLFFPLACALFACALVGFGTTRGGCLVEHKFLICLPVSA